jgi:hypothetical protein
MKHQLQHASKMACQISLPAPFEMRNIKQYFDNIIVWIFRKKYFSKCELLFFTGLSQEIWEKSVAGENCKHGRNLDNIVEKIKILKLFTSYV